MGIRKYTLGQAAKDGLMVTVRCPRCDREASFMASDLMVFYGTHKHPGEVPFKCSQCGRKDLTTKVEPLKTYHTENPLKSGRKVIWRPYAVRN